MISKLSLLGSMGLLASVTFALPSSRLEVRPMRRRGDRQSQPVNRIEVATDTASYIEYSSNWAGAIRTEANGTFTTITGTFTVPIPAGTNGAASAWVGIDGDTCQNAILQTGVDFMVAGNAVSYAAWYEWYPDYAYDFNISISTGDVIRASVTAFSTTSGVAVVEDLTTGQTVTKDLTSVFALCQQNAEWIVEDYEQNGYLVNFADFGSATFSNATASGPSGITYTPAGAAIINIEQHNQVLTNVTMSGDNVTVTYV